MVEDFRRDLQDNLEAIRTNREALLRSIRELRDDDLAATRRGGWSIRDVLRHLIDSEVAYTKVMAFLRGSPVELSNATSEDLASPEAAGRALKRARQAMLSLLDGVDEATFYDLRALGREQYSVVSVLENVAAHDHEHREQIARTLAAAGS